jgi:hypothetical protein
LKLPAIATTDETWHVRSGRVVRRPKEPLAPGIESFEQLYDRMLDIGAYNFGAQYQQTPFVHMNDGEVRGGCFAGPDDPCGFPGRWFGTISERRIMAYEVFGLGDHHPAAPPQRLSLEEFARSLECAQAHARSREDDE